jgi:hypothetical protein
MGIKETVGRAVGKVETAVERVVEDAKDAFSEGKHRAAAATERERRELAGDEMDPMSRAGSTLNELKHDVQADAAETKRSLRENP